MKQISIGIYHYSNALKSAIYGLEEMFMLANNICKEQQLNIRFSPTIFVEPPSIEQKFAVILLPPSLHSQAYLQVNPKDLNWLISQHEQGATIATACAGAFILAATSLVDRRAVTTHWGLSELFHQTFPHIELKSNEILIDHGDVITAGGMMSWVDLGFELINKHTNASVMRNLGKQLVVDTAPREQRFYQQFKPTLLHGDQAIVRIQQSMNLEYMRDITVQSLASHANLTVRTMQRRFVKATGDNPNRYLQRLRIQKACDLIESSQASFETIAHQVGYEDASACRKVFIKTMGLTPKEFRMRFTRG
ncbi:helix-turn-helix domain-containing protein [Vibrio tapetis subsp. quintayensis]|uniref:GlxA family transcriptional regulator n=1 Tax=Vibrio tapetis TaxID=52443 RepID=UPI0025B4B1EB|nr:helix-turn-helix domain-containing protein [Vibrio tapetis]MDN3680967.1 helix-turn-helix domain-containing protein [Vibrio tapetis subsp. quintayensis]